MKNKNERVDIKSLGEHQDLITKLMQKNLKGGIGCPPPTIEER